MLKCAAKCAPESGAVETSCACIDACATTISENFGKDTFCRREPPMPTPLGTTLSPPFRPLSCTLHPPFFRSVDVLMACGKRGLASAATIWRALLSKGLPTLMSIDPVRGPTTYSLDLLTP